MNLSIVSFDTILLWVFCANFFVALILDQSAPGRDRFAAKEEEP